MISSYQKRRVANIPSSVAVRIAPNRIAAYHKRRFAFAIIIIIYNNVHIFLSYSYNWTKRGTNLLLI